VDLQGGVVSVDYGLQNEIVDHLQANPEHERALLEMADWEEAHERELGLYESAGWTWADVHTPPSTVNVLIAAGIVDLVYDSRSTKHYRLQSRTDTLAAIGSSKTPVWEVGVNPDDDSSVAALFALVAGHERAKQLLRYAVKAPKPVHSLLYGPPGTAKSLMLGDIGSLAGAQFYVGSTTSRSGLVGLLLKEKPRFLCLDELDKMRSEDTTVLLNLMETGMVTRLQNRGRDNEKVTMVTKVFAAANDLARISAPLLSRFARLHIPAYTKAEFLEVASKVLEVREGCTPRLGEIIARSLAPHSLDIRDAVRVARMANGDHRRVPDIVQTLFG